MSRRVLHAVASAGDSYGGVSTALASLGAVEAAAAHDASLLTLYRPEQGTAVLSRLPSWFDVEVVRPGPLAGRFHGGSRLTAGLERLVPQHDLVVLHGVFDLASLVGGRMARRFGVPYLLWPHGSLDPYDLTKHAVAKRRLAGVWRENLDGAAALMCTTTREAELLTTFGSRTRREVLPLPLYDELSELDRPAARRLLGLRQEARVVLYLGRIDPKKGLSLLLDAFEQVAGRHDVLVIAGSGDRKLTEALRMRAHASRNADRILFTGWVDQRRRGELLAAADLFVLLSDNENYSMATAEAVAAGLPTLVSDQVYLADELARCQATVVVARSLPMVARQLRRLLDDASLRDVIGATGRRWAAEHLSVPRVAQRYANLVGKVLTSCQASAY